MHRLAVLVGLVHEAWGAYAEPTHWDAAIGPGSSGCGTSEAITYVLEGGERGRGFAWPALSS